MSFFSFLDRFGSYKSKIVKILSLRQELESSVEDSTSKDLLKKLPNFEKNELIKIDKSISETGKTIENIADVFKCEFDEKYVSNFSETASPENLPSSVPRLVIYFQTIAVVCSPKTLLNKNNFENLINSLSICLKTPSQEHAKYCIQILIDSAINNDEFKWEPTSIQQIMKVFTENVDLCDEQITTIIALSKKILGENSKESEDSKEVVISSLLHIVKNSKTSIDYFIPLLTIIEPYVSAFNTCALNLMWELLKYNEMFKSGGRRILNTLISSVVNRINDKQKLVIERGDNIGVPQKEGKIYNEDFSTGFDGKLDPIDFEFFFEENFFKKVVGEDILLLNIINESMKGASLQAIEEFFQCFMIKEDIISAIVFLYSLSTMAMQTRIKFLPRILDSFIFNRKEGVFGPVIISHNTSMLRTYAITLFKEKPDIKEFNKLISETEHFLSSCDFLIRMYTVFGNSFKPDNSTANKIKKINRSLISFQLESADDPMTSTGIDKSKICRHARSALLIALFDFVKTGDANIITTIVEIGQETSLTSYSALATSFALPKMNEFSVTVVEEMISKNPEFARLLILDLVDYSRTNEMSQQISKLTNAFIQSLNNCLDEEILYATLCILSKTPISFNLEPEMAQVLASSIISECSNRISNFLVTMNTLESYFSGFITYFRPSFIVLLFALQSEKILDIILKSADESQNVIYLHEAAIDEMLLSVINNGKPKYKGVPMSFTIPEDFCREMLRKIIPECTSKDMIQKLLLSQKFDDTFEDILTACSKEPIYMPLIGTFENCLSFQNNGNFFNSSFSIVMDVKIDRNRLHAQRKKEVFEVPIFRIEDKNRQNWFTIILRYTHFKIEMTVESRNVQSTSRVDIADFTKSFDSYNQKWTLMVVNVNNGKVARIHTLYLTHDQIQERKTTDFAPIRIGPGSFIVGATRHNKCFEGENIVFGQTRYISIYNRIFEPAEVIEFYKDDNSFSENLLMSTKSAGDPFTRAKRVGVPSENLSQYLKTNSFITNLCTQRNIELILNQHKLKACGFMLQRSANTVSEEFPIVQSFNAIENKDYKTYLAAFNAFKILLVNDQGLKFLDLVLLNPLLWQNCIEKVTHHWATVLFSTIKNSTNITCVFRNVLALFNCVYDRLETKPKENIAMFLARIAMVTLKADDIHALCAVIIKSTTTKKATLFMHLLRCIGERVNKSALKIPFAFFYQFLVDKDPKLFAETICALSTVFGSQFHSFIPQLVEKFDTMLQKMEIFNELMQLIKEEPNIATFVLATKFHTQSTPEIQAILDSQTIKVGHGWFKEIAELVNHSDQATMNRLIMILANQCTKIQDDNQKLNDIEQIMVIFFKNFSREQMEIDPFQLFMSNFFSAANYTDNDMQKIIYWCVASTFFKIVTTVGNSSFLLNYQEDAKEALCTKEDEEFFTKHRTKGRNPHVVYELSLDSSKQIPSISIRTSYDIISQFVLPDKTKVLINYVMNRNQGKEMFTTIDQFGMFNYAVGSTHNELNSIIMQQTSNINSFRVKQATEIPQDFQDKLQKVFTEAETYTRNYESAM